MPKLLLPLFLLLLLGRVGRAQEILADVSITTENVTVSDRQLLQQMQNDMRQFLNTRSWTGQNYRPEERIKCKFFVGLTGIPQAGTYTASVRVLTTRPVYGTGYQTNVLSFADRGWIFNYSPQNPIDFSENTFVGNLSSLLSFYAYIIVGMDKDSFARLSGSPYYDRARNILQNAATQTVTNEADNGWKDSEPRNRYWLLNNLQDPQLEAFRTAAYAYYREGPGHLHREAAGRPRQHIRRAEKRADRRGAPAGDAAGYFVLHHQVRRNSQRLPHQPGSAAEAAGSQLIGRNRPDA